jgi:hypothetical protein
MTPTGNGSLRPRLCIIREKWALWHASTLVTPIIFEGVRGRWSKSRALRNRRNLCQNSIWLVVSKFRLGSAGLWDH